MLRVNSYAFVLRIRALPLLVVLLAIWPTAVAQLDREPIAGLLPIEIGDGAWEKVIAGGIVRRLIEVEGSRIKEGVAIGIVDAPPERVFRVITDNAHFAVFMPYVRSSTVEAQPDGSIINYQYLDLPFVANREYKIRIENTIEETDGVKMWQSAWTHVKGFGNVKENHGSWRLLELAPERTLVIYQVLTDPGGLIPTFLKNRATKTSLSELLKSVRNRVVDPSYDTTG